MPQQVESQRQLGGQLQKELDRLVKEVIKRRDRIIPVIGDNCFIGDIDNTGENKKVPLQQWIAEKLLDDESSPEIIDKIRSEGYRGLDILFEEYRRIKKDVDDVDANFVDYADDIKEIIADGITDNKLHLRDDVREFLLAGKFEVVATTCPFHILEEEINYDGQEYNVSSFAPISSTQGSRSEATLKLPSIYQIFGDCEGDEWVAGEEDLLKFLHYLNQTETEKGYGASQLVKYIKDKRQDDNKGLGLLMPIGCDNLPNWLFRFLWYPFSQARLDSGNKSQGGVWPEYSSDESFYKFLCKYHFKTFSGSTNILRVDDNAGDPVLERLTKEFNAKENNLKGYASENLGVQWGEKGEWDFFISYASEDVDLANRIYNTLTNECGKTVWMDRRGRIKPGDEYWTAIKHGITHSSKFIFLITNNYLRKAIEKNHKDENTGEVGPTGVYKEIEKIKEFFIVKRWDGQRGYAIPIVIEGTTVTYTDINGDRHENVTLGPGLLEKLPKYKEYEMLQTDFLFTHIQDLVCPKEGLEEELKKLL